MAKKDQKKEEEFLVNYQLLTEKLNSFLAQEGFENFSVKRFEITSDCAIVTENYCRSKGMKRKRVMVDGKPMCYCAF